MQLLATLARHLRFLRYSLRALGGRRLVASSLQLALDPAARTHDSGFDRRWGTDTTIGVTPEEAALPAHRRANATAYLPTMDVDLSAMLSDLDWPEELRASASFVDIGSGKGRVVLLAAMRRFREVVGVELSARLHSIAEHNAALMVSREALVSPVRFVCEDATAFELPGGPLVLYLYHPFREDVASALIDRVVATLADFPRPAAIIYGHPLLQAPLDPAVFARGGMFRRSSEGGRDTRSFRIGWSIWTNLAWLAVPHARAA